MSKVYVITQDQGTEEVSTLREVAELLGVSRVSGKDIEDGKYPTVDVQDLSASTDSLEDLVEEQGDEEVLYTVEEAPEDTTEDLEEPGELIAEVVLDEQEDEEVSDTIELDLEEDTEDDVELDYPEVGDFESVDEIKKFVKELSNDQLEEWLELEGVEHNPSDHEAINRMRMAVAIRAVHFPESVAKSKPKKKSKYADYSLEDLVQIALDNDVAVRDAKGDERIERMYTIMALREAGLLA